MATTTDGAATAGDDATAAFAQRVLTAVLGAQEVQAMYLGDRLGYYRALAAEGPATPAELAVRTGSSPRYAQEWLEHQAVAGYLEVEDPAVEAASRRYSLPPGATEVLTAELSLDHVLPLARFTAALGKQLDALVDAYRTGGGVSWATFGDDAREAQAEANRPLFLGPLAREHLPAIPDVDAALRAGGRVADIGCGYGWSSIGIALGYPTATVDGFDVDGPSVAVARRNAAEAGVDGRVRFLDVDAAAVDPQDGYDVVIAVECVHDMADPVSVLRAMRRLVTEGGTVLVVDERAAETFTAPGDEVERLMYGYSLACCLADGLSHQPSAATGTVMRPDTLRRYAREAGFADVEVLDLPDDFLRFYRLVG
jgi:2-polyprenyl-3-methyl-5-hydroxy-6-metoxy-1,4-benzoquinol methylase